MRCLYRVRGSAEFNILRRCNWHLHYPVQSQRLLSRCGVYYCTPYMGLVLLAFLVIVQREAEVDGLVDEEGARGEGVSQRKLLSFFKIMRSYFTDIYSLGAVFGRSDLLDLPCTRLRG